MVVSQLVGLITRSHLGSSGATSGSLGNDLSLLLDTRKSPIGPCESVAMLCLRSLNCDLTASEQTLREDTPMDEEVVLDAKTWIAGDVIHRGGFGTIRSGTEKDSTEQVAIKFIPNLGRANRDPILAEVVSEHVLPVLDQGEHQGDWVLVMPMATMSLRDKIRGGTLPEETAKDILFQIAKGLVESAPIAVHRDLKPENVLLYQGRWVLTDFGIARYAEESTDIQTWKGALTPTYAAPEQWDYKHATEKTDVYAFGIVAYELLSGEPPFQGSNLREQHLTASAPRLANVDASLSGLVARCLNKNPDQRPTAQEIVEVLSRTSDAQRSPRLNALRQAGAQEHLEQSERSAVLGAEEAARRSRESIVAGARSEFELISTEIVETFQSESAAVVVTTERNGSVSLRLGEGLIRISPCGPVTFSPRTQDQTPFDIYAVATIDVRSQRSRDGYLGRAHSIWYCEPRGPGSLGWYEVAFRSGIFDSGFREVEPFALDPSDGDGLSPFSGITGGTQLSWPFTRIAPGGLDEFIERWATLLAEARTGLRRPPRLPERDTDGSWRRRDPR